MTVIDNSAALADFCADQAKARFITVDTEFMRDTTYWPKLCLIQVAGPDSYAAIDTMKSRLDLAPLFKLLNNKKILKVFHSARQDMEIFYQLMDKLPAPIFDTQVAAMVCGFGDSIGYDNLVRKLTGAQVDKSSRFADWSKRPLRQRQIDYALSDVIHLRPVYVKLAEQLEKSGRASWLDEEMAVLTAPKTYSLEPRESWHRLKTRSNNRRYLALTRELAAWREEEAQRRDVPRNRVLRDEQLLDIAAHQPVNVDDLARTRGLNSETARGKIGKAILKAVEAGLAVADKDCPIAKPKPDHPGGLGPVLDLLKVLLKMKCDSHGVAQKLIANTADLEAIAASDKAEVPALQGWRREVFGEDALALKHGKLALSTDGKRIKLLPISAAKKKS